MRNNDEVLEEYGGAPLLVDTSYEVSVQRSSMSHSSVPPVSRPLTPQRIILGVLICVFLMCNSIGQSEYDQWRFHKIKFKSYYFLTYISMSCMVIVWPLMVVLEYLYDVIVHNDTTFRQYQRKLSSKIQSSRPAFHFTSYATVSACLAPILFFSTYTWYVSLAMLPVAVNSAMFRALLLTSTYVLSVLFLRESVTPKKLLVVMIVIAGIVCVGVGKAESDDESVPNHRTEGYLLVFISSLSWAFYAVMYGKWVGDVNLHLVLLNQSLMGVVILSVGWILVPLWWHFDVEPSLWRNTSSTVWLFLVYNSLFAVSYFVAYALGCSVTSPFYISITSLFGIPVSLLADSVLHDAKYNAVTVVGMCLIVIGVVAMNVLKWRKE